MKQALAVFLEEITSYNQMGCYKSLAAAILEGTLFRIIHILRGVPIGLDWISLEFESADLVDKDQLRAETGKIRRGRASTYSYRNNKLRPWVFGSHMAGLRRHFTVWREDHTCSPVEVVTPYHAVHFHRSYRPYSGYLLSSSVFIIYNYS